MPFDTRHRSRHLLDGRDRAPARSMLKAIGYDDEALSRPIIGVANTWIETMPCNFHLRDLAEHVKAGIREAGGTPMEFNTVAISDGITMGTEGMKASLVSREVIADSIELVGRGHMFDAVVALAACDKTIPGCAMGLIRLDVPGFVLYGGSIAPGRFEGRDVTIQDVFEAVGAHARGLMTDEQFRDLEDHACPGAGACGGQFTANTMALALEFLGLSPVGTASPPGLDPRKKRVAHERGRPARDGPAHAGAQAPRHPDAPGLRERHRRRGRHRRLDQRRAAPAGDRPRGRRAADDRRLRHGQRADPDARRPQARRALRRRRPRPCRRGSTCRPAAALGPPAPPRPAHPHRPS